MVLAKLSSPDVPKLEPIRSDSRDRTGTALKLFENRSTSPESEVCFRSGTPSIVLKRNPSLLFFVGQARFSSFLRTHRVVRTCSLGSLSLFHARSIGKFGSLLLARVWPTEPPHPPVPLPLRPFLTRQEGATFIGAVPHSIAFEDVRAAAYRVGELKAANERLNAIEYIEMDNDGAVADAGGSNPANEELA